MPNYCENTLIITGDKKQLKQFKEDVKSKDKDAEPVALCFNKIYPIPKDLKITAGCLGDTEEQKELTKKEKANKKKYGYKDWYDWCCDNWGTKWDAISPELTDESDNELIYFFSTAWSPPLQFVLYVSKKYPKLTFEIEYFEGGMGFKGIAKLKNGKVIKDINSDMTDEDYKNMGYYD